MKAVGIPMHDSGCLNIVETYGIVESLKGHKPLVSERCHYNTPPQSVCKWHVPPCATHFPFRLHNCSIYTLSPPHKDLDPCDNVIRCYTMTHELPTNQHTRVLIRSRFLNHLRQYVFLFHLTIFDLQGGCCMTWQPTPKQGVLWSLRWEPDFRWPVGH